MAFLLNYFNFLRDQAAIACRLCYLTPHIIIPNFHIYLINGLLWSILCIRKTQVELSLCPRVEELLGLREHDDVIQNTEVCWCKVKRIIKSLLLLKAILLLILILKWKPQIDSQPQAHIFARCIAKWESILEI